jgi:serine-type D-Ala-D-Ala carboxypeptidase/endopeptidase
MNRHLAALIAALLSCAASATSQSMSDAEIRKILVQRIDDFHQSVGIVVGVVDRSGRRIITYGVLDKGDTRPLNGDTIFEIGSVSKVFTSLLLSDMVQDGEVALTDPVQKYLPATVTMPKRGDLDITLQDLATHTSGLPRLPSNLTPKDPSNPYADYTVDQLYNFLSNYKLTRDIGSQYEYSNLGGGLLGHVLARRAGMSYEALLTSRICNPLGMNSTEITVPPDMKARFAIGHDAQMKAVPYWDIPTLAGAGGIRSSANDLLTFLAANLGYQKSPLAPDMAAMLTVRRPTGNPGLEIALGWHVFTLNGGEIVWHNGGTGGFRSFIGYSPKSRTGVVVLSNAQTAKGVDDIGTHLLDPSAPLFSPPKEDKEVHVDPKLFDGYTGQYPLAAAFVITITREGDHLFEQATGQPKFEIFPEGDRDFFLKVVNAQITFEVDSQDRATALVLHQNGMNQRAPKTQ